MSDFEFWHYLQFVVNYVSVYSSVQCFYLTCRSQCLSLRAFSFSSDPCFSLQCLFQVCFFNLVCFQASGFFLSSTPQASCVSHINWVSVLTLMHGWQGNWDKCAVSSNYISCPLPACDVHSNLPSSVMLTFSHPSKAISHHGVRFTLKCTSRSHYSWCRHFYKDLCAEFTSRRTNNFMVISLEAAQLIFHQVRSLT